MNEHCTMSFSHRQDDFEVVDWIRTVLDSDERTTTLITWLSSEDEEEEEKRRRRVLTTMCQPQQSLSQQSDLGGRHRVSISFIILNGIRDAVRPRLEATTTTTTTTVAASRKLTYEESFPSLPSSSSMTTNVLVSRKLTKLKGTSKSENNNNNTNNCYHNANSKSTNKAGKQPRRKRRIRPNSVSSSWNKGQGNIVNLPQSLSTTDDWPPPATAISVSTTTTTTTTERFTSHGSDDDGSSNHDTTSQMTERDIIHPPSVSAWRGAGNVSSATTSSTTTTGPFFDTAVTEYPDKVKETSKSMSATANQSHKSKRLEQRPPSRKPPPPAGEEEVLKTTVVVPDSIENTTTLHDDDDSICKLPPPEYDGGTAKIERLARIYVSLIRNNLVPSTALELHLLVRLLTTPQDKKPKSTTTMTTSEPKTTSETETTSTTTTMLFQTVFASTKSCHVFAIAALRMLKSMLCNLPLTVLEHFVNCPPLASKLPDLTDELRDVVKSRRRQQTLLLPETEAISITGNGSSSNATTHNYAAQTMPLLSIPFDHERDSRHNYKSREQVATYKNREECRDAFMYQLRAFQDMRGKVVDGVEADRSIDRIRTASRKVIESLLTSNMCWFAQLFCDLLIQIGLVPMEETDKELLNITDKDKLQKLHKRFSTKGTQTSRSSKVLAMDPSKSPRTASPVVEAQQLFPGHQEFFFIFIMSTDCYSLGVHLKNRLTFEFLKRESSSDSTKKGIEKHVMVLQLLSKFIGLLLFSPTWHDSNVAGEVSHHNALFSFDPHLDIHGMVERAYKERHLVVTVPWVVELLKLARWSLMVQKSNCFKRILALLLRIRRLIRQDEKDEPSAFSVNMQLVSLYLETLFGDIIGLERAATLSVPPVADLVATAVSDSDGNMQLDNCPLPLSNSFIFASNPYPEELVALLSSLSKKNSKPSSSSRRLTPYPMGGRVDSSTDPLESCTSISFSPVKSKRSVTLGGDYNHLVQSEDSHYDFPIVPKLVEAFFHQHRDLKDICEFVIDQTLKNAAVRVRKECVASLLQETALHAADVESVSLLKAVESSRTFLAADLRRSIPEALAILCPPTIDSRVRKIAEELSISHAIRLGKASVESVAHELKELTLMTKCKVKKTDSAHEDTRKTGLGEDQVEDALVVFRNALANRMWERRSDYTAAVVRSAKVALSKSKNGGDPALRRTFAALGIGSVPLLQWCLNQECDDSHIKWTITVDFLAILTSLSSKAETTSQEDSMRHIMTYFSSKGWLAAFIELCVNSNGGDASSLGTLAELLHDMRRVNLISSATLEVELIQSLKRRDNGRILCQHYVSIISECDDGLNAERDSSESVVAARLRHELSLHEVQDTKHAKE